MKKKSIAIIICLFMLLGVILPATPGAYAEPNLVSIQHDGVTIEEITVPTDERETLTAVVNDFSVDGWQWQLLIDAQSDQWVDIYGKTEAECEFSYAMVKSLLDDSNSVYIRCEAICGETGVYSDPVCITMVEPKPGDSDDLDEEMVLVEEGTPSPENEKESKPAPAKYSLSRSADETEISPNGAEADTEYVTITIKYLDESSLTEGAAEAPLYTAYTAVLEKGSAFNQPVVSPTFLGFAPYYDKNNDGNIDDDATTIVLDYDEGALTSDVTFKVYYKAIKVNYAIRYLFQNIHDDLYTENESYYYTGTEYTGTPIEDSDIVSHLPDGTIPVGFEKLYHYPDAVAADGSTVFECYFDRNYYMLQFDMNGGYGVEPIYARYGTPFLVNDPVRHGYVFKGWNLMDVDKDNDGTVDDCSDNEIDELPGTIPNANQKYRAEWGREKTTYTVVYWKENANDNGYSYWGSTKFNATSGDYVDGSDSIPASISNGEEDYFTYNDAKTDKHILIEGDGSSVVNVYYTRNYYTITFKAPGLCTLDPHTHGDGNCEYQYLCGYDSHTHTAECLSCELEGHIHTDDCCKLEVHEHNSEKGCQLACTHVCDAYCYGATGDAELNNGSSTAIGNITGNSEPQNGYIYKVDTQAWGNTTSAYYLYHNDKWYSTTQSATTGTPLGTGEYSTGNFIRTTYTATKYATTHNCKHSHDNTCYTCEKPVHTHDSVSCDYSNCAEHVHKDVCYGNCPINGHTHTDACYGQCIKPTHTHNGNCTNSSQTNIVKSVTRKYGASLADIWPVEDGNGEVYNDGERWSPSESSYYSAVLVYIDIMPPDDFTLTLNTANYDTYYMHYYLESLNGDGDANYTYGGQTKNFDLGFTVNANYNYVTDAEDFFDIKGFEKWTSNPTFKSGQIDLGNGGGDVYFYYERSKYKLQYHNVSEIVETKENVPYEAPLADYEEGEPAYPSTLEPNAYEFNGWYTTPQCFDGTKVDFDNETMPDSNLILYASWVPKTHKVNFFETYDDMLAYEKAPTVENLNKYKYKDSESPYEVSHGNVVGKVNSPEARNDGDMTLTFAGWFYIENGEKKAFTPMDMPITGDLNVFADWSSRSPQPYRIQYTTTDGKKVAEDTYGYAYGGSTRTFTAKAGDPFNQLYPEYNTGYFPTIGSHSITIKAESDDNKEYPVNNAFTFKYVKASNIKYTIKYIDKETGTSVIDPSTGQPVEDEVKYTDKAVVTERFKPIEGMAPSSYFERLVISVEQDSEGNWVGSESNEIIFYYTKNETTTYYAVHHMLQTIESAKNNTTTDTLDYTIEDGTKDFVESPVYQEGTGDIDSIIKITPQTFTGFELIGNKGQVYTGKTSDTDWETQDNVTLSSDGKYEITVKQNGTELYVFYHRLSYNYSANYYLYNTTEEVPGLPNTAVKSGSAPYGDTVTITAPAVDGYTCVSKSPQSMQIRVDEAQNVLTFYYSPTQYTVEYKAIVSDGGDSTGMLSKTIEVKTGTEEFDGSMPKTNSEYVFDGWYLDEECTQPVKDSNKAEINSSTNLLKPKKSELSETESNIFYAKFIRATGDFTINRTSTADTGRVYVYEVKNVETNEVIYVTTSDTVTIKDLPYGKYDVTQQNDWSWRNTDEAQRVEHNNEGESSDTEVNFNKTVSKDSWLNGNSPLVKNKRGD